MEIDTIRTECASEWMQKVGKMRQGKAQAESLKEQIATQLRDAKGKASALELEVVSLRRQLAEVIR